MNASGRIAGSRLRCLAVWLGSTLALAALLGALGADLDAARAAALGGTLEEQPFDRLLVWACATLAAAAATWLWVLTGVVVLEAAGAGRRERPRRVPAVVRRVVLLACGVAVVGTSGPALARSAALPGEHDGRSGTGIQGLPLPDRATGGATLAWLAEATVAARRVEDGAARVVLVRPGDSLWSIAAADLPSTADDAAVATHWRRIYDLNRVLIGPDPDLIHPGQRLELPAVR
jgi:nucleoid-associated protein YgaU